MRFEDLPQTEREALAAYGYEIASAFLKGISLAVSPSGKTNWPGS